ncbi:MAG: hypothetical protein LBU55_00710, partial [Elusimicrobiota bacterium]|nr:hypothetical protein [Elusimicrobiota bacterium]
MENLKMKLRKICDKITKNIAKFCLFSEELRAVKAISIFVINCFLLSFVYGQAIAIVSENMRTASQFKQIFSDFTLPYSYGKITSSHFANSDSVIINIQDLHLHPEVQKNISNIIATFDKEYGVRHVYMEGAYDTVDTTWLTDIKNTEIRNQTINEIFSTGVLTGPEYYSSITSRPYLVKGLEKKDPYLDNLKRFGDILYSQDNIKDIVKNIDNTVQMLKASYYNKKQMKIENLSNQYLERRVEANKYYSLLEKYSDSLGVDLSKYENTNLYMELLKKNKTIDYQRATLELQQFILRIRDALPYAAYKMIADSTSNFTEIEKLYVYIIRLSRQNNMDLNVNFPELNKFLSYIEISQKVNPLEMIGEEEILKNELTSLFALDQGQKDVAFLSAFTRYLKDYFSGQITAIDYAHYVENIGNFKKIWFKYLGSKHLDLLTPYEKTADIFYNINLMRNQYFIENIDSIKNSSKLSGAIDDKLSVAEKVVKSLKKAKNVSVVVTGGFHTEGLSHLLASKGISYIVIMPNVSGGVKIAEEAYYEFAKAQREIMFSAINILNLSQAPVDVKLSEIASASVSTKKPIDDINDILSTVASGKYDSQQNQIQSAIISQDGELYVLTVTYTDAVTGSTLNKVFTYHEKTKTFVLGQSKAYKLASRQVDVFSKAADIIMGSKVSIGKAGVKLDEIVKNFDSALSDDPNTKISLDEIKNKINDIKGTNSAYVQDFDISFDESGNIVLKVEYSASKGTKYFRYDAQKLEFDAEFVELTDEQAQQLQQNSGTQQPQNQQQNPTNPQDDDDGMHKSIGSAVKSAVSAGFLSAIFVTVASLIFVFVGGIFGIIFLTIMLTISILVFILPMIYLFYQARFISGGGLVELTYEEKIDCFCKIVGALDNKTSNLLIENVFAAYNIGSEQLRDIKRAIYEGKFKEFLSENTTISRYIKSFINRMSIENTDANVIMEYSDIGVVKFNWSRVGHLFFDQSGNVKNTTTLNVFVSHELRHQSVEKKLGEAIGRGFFAELFVSIADLFSLLSIFFRGLFSKSTTIAERKAELHKVEDKSVIDRAFTVNTENTIGAANVNQDMLQRQIEASDKVAELGNIVTLGTGGGKSGVGKNAMTKILVNAERKGSRESILYSSYNETLIYRDMSALASYFNSDEVQNILINSGVRTVYDVDGNPLVLVGFLGNGGDAVAFNAKGEEITEFKLNVSDESTIKVTKSNLYKYSKVVGAGRDTLNWDNQDARNPAFRNAGDTSEKDLGQLSQNWVFVADEAHALLNDLNQQFIRSSGESLNVNQLPAQSWVIDYALSNRDNGKWLVKDEDYEQKDGNCLLNEKGRRKMERLYRQIQKSDDQSEGAKAVRTYSRDEFLNLAQYSLDAQTFKDGQQYVTTSKKGKIFTLNYPNHAPIKATVIGEVARAGEVCQLQVEIGDGDRKQVKTVSAAYNDIDENNIFEILGYRKIDGVFASLNAREQTIVSLMSDKTSEVSKNSVWEGRQLAVEVYLERVQQLVDNGASDLVSVLNGHTYNFSDRYSIDKKTVGKSSLLDWMNSDHIRGVTGFTGTMPEDRFESTLANQQLGGRFKSIVKVESASVAKPSQLCAQIFSTNDARDDAVIDDMFAMRQALQVAKFDAEVNGTKNLNDSGMAVFRDLNALNRAVNIAKDRLRTQLKEANPQWSQEQIENQVNETIEVIDGAHDDPSSISSKVERINTDAKNGKYGKMIFATGVVQVGVDVNVSFLLNAMPENQDAAAKHQTKTRVGRAGKEGISREYYSMEGIKRNDNNSDLVDKLKKSYSTQTEDVYTQGNTGSEVGTDGAYSIVFQDFVDNDINRRKVSNVGLDILEQIGTIAAQDELASETAGIRMQTVENDILKQFDVNAQLFHESSTAWQKSVFKKELSKDDIIKIGINKNGYMNDDIAYQAGLKELERMRESLYNAMQEARIEALEELKKIDQEVKDEFGTSASKYGLGLGEISASAKKIKLKYERLGELAHIKITEVIENEMKQSEQVSLEQSQAQATAEAAARKRVSELIKSADSISFWQHIINFLHWLYSGFLTLITKFGPILITAIVSGFFGLIQTTGITLFATALAGVNFIALAVLLVVIAVALILINSAVKRVDSAISEQDNENIEIYNNSPTATRAASATSASSNRLLSAVSKAGFISGLLMMAVALIVPQFMVFALAIGLVLAFISIVCGIILVAKNWKAFKNKKVSPHSSEFQRWGSGIIFGLLAGVAFIVPVVLLGPIGCLLGIAFVGIVALIKWITSYIRGNTKSVWESLRSRDNWGFLIGVVVGALLFGLFAFQVIVFTALAAKMISAVVIIGFAIIATFAKIYDWYKTRSKTTLHSVKHFSEMLVAAIFVIGMAVYGLYMLGFFVLSWQLVVVAVAVAIFVAFVMWLLSLFDVFKNATSDLSQTVNSSTQVFMKMADMGKSQQTLNESMKVGQDIANSMAKIDGKVRSVVVDSYGQLLIDGKTVDVAISDFISAILEPLNASSDDVDIQEHQGEKEQQEYVSLKERITGISKEESDRLKDQLEPVLEWLQMNYGENAPSTVEELIDVIDKNKGIVVIETKDGTKEIKEYEEQSMYEVVDEAFDGAIAVNGIAVNKVVGYSCSQAFSAASMPNTNVSNLANKVATNLVSAGSIIMPGFEDYANGIIIEEVPEEVSAQIEKLQNAGYQVEVAEINGRAFYVLTKDGVSFPMVPVYSTEGELNDVDVFTIDTIFEAYFFLADIENASVTGRTDKEGYIFFEVRDVYTGDYINFYPFQEDGTPSDLTKVTDSLKLRNVFLQLMSIYGEDNVKVETDSNGNLLFKITRYGVTCSFYPYDSNGNLDKNLFNKIDSTFSLCDSLMDEGYSVNFIMEDVLDSNGKVIGRNSCLEVTGDKDFKTKTYIEYDENGNIDVEAAKRLINSSNLMHDFFTQLASIYGAENVKMEADENKYVYFRVTSGSKSDNFYPYDKNGRIDKNFIENIGHVFNVWQTFLDAGYDVTLHTETGTDVATGQEKQILYFEINDNEGFSMNIYPFDKNGNIADIDASSIQKLQKSFQFLKSIYGKDGGSVILTSDANQNMIVRITTKDGKIYDFYPYDINGKFNENFATNACALLDFRDVLLVLGMSDVAIESKKIIDEKTGKVSYYVYFKITGPNDFAYDLYPQFDENGKINEAATDKLIKDMAAIKSFYDQLYDIYSKNGAKVELTEDKNGYMVFKITTKDGKSKEFYPYKSDGSLNVNFVANVNSIISTWSMLSDLGYNVEPKTEEVTDKDGKVVGYNFYFEFTTKDGTVLKIYPQYDANGNILANNLEKLISETAQIHSMYKILCDIYGSANVIMGNDDNGIYIKITATDNRGNKLTQTVYPYDSSGTLNENFVRDVQSFFSFWVSISDSADFLGLTVTPKTKEVIVNKNGKDVKEYFSYFEVTGPAGFAMDIYPQFDEKTGAVKDQEKTLENLTNIFGAYNALTSIYGEGNVIITEDKTGNMVFRVTATDSKGKTITSDFYPFDSNGQFNKNFVNNTRGVIEFWKSLSDLDFSNINIGTEEIKDSDGKVIGNYLYVEVTDANGFNMKLYPEFDEKTGEVSNVNSNDIALLRDFYSELLKMTGVENVKIVTDGGNLFFEITSKDSNGNTSTSRFAPFKSDGKIDKNFVANVKHIYSTKQAFEKLGYNVTTTIEDGVLSITISKDGKTTLTIYPFDESGKIIEDFNIDAIDKMYKLKSDFEAAGCKIEFKNVYVNGKKHLIATITSKDGNVLDDIYVFNADGNVFNGEALLEVMKVWDTLEQSGYDVSIKNDGKNYIVSMTKDGTTVNFPITWDKNGKPNFNVEKAEYLFNMAADLKNSGFEVEYLLVDGYLVVEVWDKGHKWGNPVRLPPFYLDGSLSGQIARYVNAENIKTIFSSLEVAAGKGYKVKLVYADVKDKDGNIVERGKLYIEIDYMGSVWPVDPFNPNDADPDKRTARSCNEVVADLDSQVAKYILLQGMNTPAAVALTVGAPIAMIAAIVKAAIGKRKSKRKAARKLKTADSQEEEEIESLLDDMSALSPSMVITKELIELQVRQQVNPEENEETEKYEKRIKKIANNISERIAQRSETISERKEIPKNVNVSLTSYDVDQSLGKQLVDFFMQDRVVLGNGINKKLERDGGVVGTDNSSQAQELKDTKLDNDKFHFLDFANSRTINPVDFQSLRTNKDFEGIVASIRHIKILNETFSRINRQDPNDASIISPLDITNDNDVDDFYKYTFTDENMQSIIENIVNSASEIDKNNDVYILRQLKISLMAEVEKRTLDLFQKTIEEGAKGNANVADMLANIIKTQSITAPTDKMMVLKRIADLGLLDGYANDSTLVLELTQSQNFNDFFESVVKHTIVMKEYSDMKDMFPVVFSDLSFINPEYAKGKNILEQKLNDITKTVVATLVRNPMKLSINEQTKEIMIDQPDAPIQSNPITFREKIISEFLQFNPSSVIANKNNILSSTVFSNSSPAQQQRILDMLAMNPSLGAMSIDWSALMNLTVQINKIMNRTKLPTDNSDFLTTDDAQYAISEMIDSTYRVLKMKQMMLLENQREISNNTRRQAQDSFADRMTDENWMNFFSEIISDFSPTNGRSQEDISKSLLARDYVNFNIYSMTYGEADIYMPQVRIFLQEAGKLAIDSSGRIDMMKSIADYYDYVSKLKSQIRENNQNADKSKNTKQAVITEEVFSILTNVNNAHNDFYEMFPEYKDSANYYRAINQDVNDPTKNTYLVLFKTAAQIQADFDRYTTLKLSRSMKADFLNMRNVISIEHIQKKEILSEMKQQMSQLRDIANKNSGKIDITQLSDEVFEYFCDSFYDNNYFLYAFTQGNSKNFIDDKGKIYNLDKAFETPKQFRDFVEKIKNGQISDMTTKNIIDTAVLSVPLDAVEHKELKNVRKHRSIYEKLNDKSIVVEGSEFEFKALLTKGMLDIGVKTWNKSGILNKLLAIFIFLSLPLLLAVDIIYNLVYGFLFKMFLKNLFTNNPVWRFLSNFVQGFIDVVSDPETTKADVALAFLKLVVKLLLALILSPVLFVLAVAASFMPAKIEHFLENTLGAFIMKLLSWDFWGINTWQQKLAVVLITILMLAIAVFFFLFPYVGVLNMIIPIALQSIFLNMSYFIGGIMLALILFLPKVIAGHAEGDRSLTSGKGIFVLLGLIVLVLGAVAGFILPYVLALSAALSAGLLIGALVVLIATFLLFNLYVAKPGGTRWTYTKSIVYFGAIWGGFLGTIFFKSLPLAIASIASAATPLAMLWPIITIVSGFILWLIVAPSTLTAINNFVVASAGKEKQEYEMEDSTDYNTRKVTTEIQKWGLIFFAAAVCLVTASISGLVMGGIAIAGIPAVLFIGIICAAIAAVILIISYIHKAITRGDIIDTLDSGINALMIVGFFSTAIGVIIGLVLPTFTFALAVLGFAILMVSLVLKSILLLVKNIKLRNLNKKATDATGMIVAGGFLLAFFIGVIVVTNIFAAILSPMLIAAALWISIVGIIAAALFLIISGSVLSKKNWDIRIATKAGADKDGAGMHAQTITESIKAKDNQDKFRNLIDEEKRGLLLPNNATVSNYMIRTVNELFSKGYINARERFVWVTSIVLENTNIKGKHEERVDFAKNVYLQQPGVEDGQLLDEWKSDVFDRGERFTPFGSTMAEEAINNAMDSLFKFSSRTDYGSTMSMPVSDILVQRGGEVNIVTMDRMLSKSAYDDKGNAITGTYDRGGNLLGKYARTQESRWAQVKHDIKNIWENNKSAISSTSDSTALENFINKLSSLKETDYIAIPKLSDANAKNVLAKISVVVENFASTAVWSEVPVYQSMASSQYQMQRAIATELGDFEYVLALDNIFANPANRGSMEEAYRVISDKQNDANAAASLSNQEIYFKNKYEFYKSRAAAKLRPIMSDWKVEVEVSLVSAGFGKDSTLSDFRPLNKFVEQLSSLSKSSSASVEAKNVAIATIKSLVDDGIVIETIDPQTNIATYAVAYNKNYTLKSFGKKYEDWRLNNLSLIDEMVRNNYVPSWNDFSLVASSMYLSYFYDIDLGVHSRGAVSEKIPTDASDINNINKVKTISYNDFAGGGKTFGQAENFEQLGEVTDNRDAHTAMLVGSEELHIYAMQTMWNEIQEKGTVVMNMNMTTDSVALDQNGDPLNVQGFLYGSAQQQFTGFVQSGSQNVSGYGKEFGSKRAIASVYTTGEDSFAVFLQQHYYNQGRQLGKSVPRGIHSTIMKTVWGRPYSKIGYTEMRYGENVTRYDMEIMDGIDQDSNEFLDETAEQIGWDRKFANHMFSMHYEASPVMALVLSTFLRLLMFFSGFTFATPFWFVLSLILILSQSSSASVFVDMIRKEGDFFKGFLKGLKFLFLGIPFWGNTQVLQAAGVISAGNDYYAFGGTFKEKTNEEGGGGALAKVRYDELPAKWGRWNYTSGGLALMIFGVLTALTTGFSVFMLVLYIVADLIYVIVAAAWMNGKNAYGAFIRKDGSIDSYNWWAFYGKAFLMALLQIPLSICSLIDVVFKFFGYERSSAYWLIRPFFNSRDNEFGYYSLTDIQVYEFFDNERESDLIQKEAAKLFCKRENLQKLKADIQNLQKKTDKTMQTEIEVYAEVMDALDSMLTPTKGSSDFNAVQDLFKLLKENCTGTPISNLIKTHFVEKCLNSITQDNRVRMETSYQSNYDTPARKIV